MTKNNSIDQNAMLQINDSERVEISFHTCDVCKTISFDMTVINRSIRTRIHLTPQVAGQLAKLLDQFMQLSARETRYERRT